MKLYAWNSLLIIGMNFNRNIGNYLSIKYKIPNYDIEEESRWKNFKNINEKNDREYDIIKDLIKINEKKIITLSENSIESHKIYHLLLNTNEPIIHIINMNKRDKNKWEKRAKYYYSLSENIYWENEEIDIIKWIENEKII